MYGCVHPQDYSDFCRLHLVGKHLFVCCELVHEINKKMHIHERSELIS